jgi:hypothetical protein
MEHVVFYPALDGAPAFRRFSSLDDAVRFVEHLRNAEGVSEVSVHTLSPVPLSFRAYYKVEVPQEPAAEFPAAEVPVADVPAAEVPVADVPAAEVPAAEVPAQGEPVYDVPAPAAEVPAEPVLAEAVVVAPAAATNGKKSLGFFAH